MAAGKQQVVIEVSPAGSVKIDAQCFTGAGCAKATEQIEIVLGGGGNTKKTKKPEFFAPSASGKAGVKHTF